jgi:hypothetical protein
MQIGGTTLEEIRADPYLAHVWLTVADIKNGTGEIADGRPVAFPDPFTGYDNHWILWEAWSPFSIEFPGRAPILGNPRRQGQYDETKQSWVIAAKGRPDAASTKPYKYTVAILTNPGSNEILIIDPMGQMERDPTLGG